MELCRVERDLGSGDRLTIDHVVEVGGAAVGPAGGMVQPAPVAPRVAGMVVVFQAGFRAQLPRTRVGLGSRPNAAASSARLIASRVRPVYAVDDSQPGSRTLAWWRGSCSQRLAVLEAVARADGTATRVRGLLVDGRFWYPRLPRLRFAVPDAVLLAWPEFLLEGDGVAASELFGPVGSRCGGSGFSNADGETLFDAVARTAVDWDGTTSTLGACSACNLSATVLQEFGRFDSRDELFARPGQTPAGRLAP